MNQGTDVPAEIRLRKYAIRHMWGSNYRGYLRKDTDCSPSEIIVGANTYNTIAEAVAVIVLYVRKYPWAVGSDVFDIVAVELLPARHIEIPLKTLY